MEENIIFNIFDDNLKLEVKKSCIGNIKQDKYLSGGSTGEVVSACLDNENNCIHVVKIIDTENAEYDEQKFEREISMTKVADKLGIGPKFIRSAECPTFDGNNEVLYKFIILEKFDKTLGDYLEKMNTEEQATSLSKALLELIKKCYEYRFCHGDLYYPETKDINEGNIMLNFDFFGNVKEAKLIDFEHSKSVCDDANELKKEWCGVIKYLRKEYKLLKE